MLSLLNFHVLPVQRSERIRQTVPVASHDLVLDVDNGRKPTVTVIRPSRERVHELGWVPVDVHCCPFSRYHNHLLFAAFGSQVSALLRVQRLEVEKPLSSNTNRVDPVEPVSVCFKVLVDTYGICKYLVKCQLRVQRPHELRKRRLFSIGKRLILFRVESHSWFDISADCQFTSEYIIADIAYAR